MGGYGRGRAQKTGLTARKSPIAHSHSSYWNTTRARAKFARTISVSLLLTTSSPGQTRDEIPTGYAVLRCGAATTGWNSSRLSWRGRTWKRANLLWRRRNGDRRRVMSGQHGGARLDSD